uniref:Putative nucleolar gtpase/atpase n=1 Tax=Amblyomma sculptum TaxID=1581419 RepID=A0A1E1XL83_AMBSC
MLGDGSGDRRRPYPDEFDELSLESYDYRPGRHRDSERFASFSDRSRRPLSPPRFDRDPERPFGCEDRSRPSFGPSRPRPEEEPFSIPEKRDRPFDCQSPRAVRPRFSMESELDVPPRAPNMRRGDGDRGLPRPSDHRGTPPNAGSWHPRPYGFEHARSIAEDRADSLPFRGGWCESWHPSRRGPNREDFRDTGEKCSPPPLFRQRPEGRMDLDLCPPDSSEHQDSDHKQRRPRSGYRDYDHWDSHPEELQARGQERPGVPYCDERPASFSGPGGSPFHPGQFVGNSRRRPASADQEPLPGMSGPREPYIPRNMSQSSSHGSHSGSACEERQLPDKHGIRPAPLKIENRGDPDHGAAPGCQERPTIRNPPFPNPQKSRKGEEAVKPERQELPDNSGSYGLSNRRYSGESDPPNSGIREKAVDAGCPWPKLPVTGENRAVKSDPLLGPINTECKAQLPVGFGGIHVGIQGLPAASIPPVQLPRAITAVRAPSGPVISQHTGSVSHTESGSHQRLPILVQKQQQSFSAQDLLPSAPVDHVWQSTQSLSFFGSIPQLPTQSGPHTPRPTCLDNIDRPLTVMKAGGFNEEKPPSIPSDRKLQPPPSPPWMLGCKEQLGYPELRQCFQKVPQANKPEGPQYQISSGDNDEKPSAAPTGQQPPQITSKVSCGPRKPYGPDYPHSGRQSQSSDALPKAASLPSVSSLPQEPSTCPPSVCATPQQMTTTSINVTELDISAATPFKNQDPRPLTTAYPKVRFSLPPPLLAQAQARFPASANQDESRTCAPHASVSHAKPATSVEVKQPAVSPAVQSKLGDKPSTERRSLEPPPGIPCFIAGSLQGPGIATSVPQAPVSPIYFQGQQAATAGNQKQRSPAPDCQVQMTSALPSSKLGSNVGQLKLGKSKSPNELYGPFLPSPAVAVQLASTDTVSASSKVEVMDVDAVGTGLNVQSDKTVASIGPITLPVRKLESQSALSAVNQADLSKKSELRSQITGPQNKNAALKKQQPLIMKHPANQKKKAAESKNPEAEPKKQEAIVGSEGPLSRCDPGTTDPPKPSTGTGEAPSKCSGSGFKNSEEGMGNQAASVTNQKSTSVVKQETLKTEEISEKNDETLVSCKDKMITDKETPSGSESALNDHEVSSSTPECSDEGTSVGEDKTADASKEPSANSTVTVDGGDNCDKGRKLTPKSSSPATKRDDFSDSGESEHSDTNKSTESRSPSPKKRSARGSRTDSSDDDCQDTDTETRMDDNCRSGPFNEGQIFGIPVVFKAISSPHTFWHIRSERISRDLDEIVGDSVVNQKINRAGFLCVNVATAGDAVKLLSIKKLGGVIVEAVLPSMYLRHEAKIRGVPQEYSNKELTEYFSDFGVVAARRQFTYKRLRDGTFEEYPRSSVILTFKPDATLPSAVELGSDRYSVEEYIEAPVQCFKCLRFGHSARECVSTSRCKNCGARYCLEDCRRGKPLCANCFGPHPATYTGCPRRREVAFASLWKRAFDLDAL